MNCKKCNSENIQVQRVSITKSKRKGIFYWLLFGWLIDLILWIFLTLPRLLWAIIRPNKINTEVYSEAVCQECGFSWRVK